MKNRKFNIIDIIIIILIAAILCAGVYVYYVKINGQESADADTVNLHFTVEVNGLTEEAANSFNVGDYVTLGESASGSGVIESVEVEKYKILSRNTENGTFLWSEVPDEYTAKVTIVSGVNKSDTAYTTGSENISVGKEMPFNARGAASEKCYIVDLYETE